MIGRAGDVVAVKEGGSITDAGLIQCFAASFAALHFPEAGAMSAMSYAMLVR